MYRKRWNAGSEEHNLGALSDGGLGDPRNRMRVAVHVVVDCLKYKRVVVPKIERLEQVKGELQAKISEVEAELAGS